MQQEHIHSSKYCDENYEYKHVILPKEMAKSIPKTRLLTEDEWRKLGVMQSRGWEHYALHKPEPHVLLFRRPLGTNAQTGLVEPELEKAAKEKYLSDFASNLMR